MPKAKPVRFESDTQLFATVGMFLHEWLYLETAVNRLLARMIRAPDMHASILGPNIEFRKKLNILRVGARASPHLAALKKAKAVAGLVTAAGGLYADRNNLVHYPWRRSEDGKLVILRTQAVDELVDARMVWTSKQMAWKVVECARVFNELFDIATAIKPVDSKQTNWLKVITEIEDNNETASQQGT